MPAMRKTEKESRARGGFEGWIEQRIRAALENLPHPFERKVARLRKKAAEIQTRLQHLSWKIEEQVTSKRDDLTERMPENGDEPLKPAL